MSSLPQGTYPNLLINMSLSPPCHPPASPGDDKTGETGTANSKEATGEFRFLGGFFL